MTKKKVSKKKSTKKKVTHSSHKEHSNSKIENVLIENFVSLQKVMVNLSVKFDDLTKQISKLLELFEISAKALAEKDINVEKNDKDTKEVMEKINNILDQNKTIARGLTLMHDKISDKEGHEMPSMNLEKMPKSMQSAMPRSPLRKIAPLQKTQGLEGYEKSLS